MRNRMLGLVSVCLLASTFAAAQASRTWVSGVGDDANPCSRTAPCKTFAGAISKTAAGGEIDALDPAGYGALTITKAITIDGGGGQVASILAAGTNAINVAAGVNDVVILRNLRLNGISQSPSSAGLTGINYTGGGTLVVENCDIMNFLNYGIRQATGRLSVRNTTVTNSGTAINVTAGTVTVEDSNLSGNTDGLYVTAARGTALRTTATLNSRFGFATGGSGSELNLTDCTSANNAYGIATSGVVRISNVMVTDNTTVGINYGAGAQVISWGNNHIAGNPYSVAPSVTPQQ